MVSSWSFFGGGYTFPHITKSISVFREAIVTPEVCIPASLEDKWAVVGKQFLKKQFCFLADCILGTARLEPPVDSISVLPETPARGWSSNSGAHTPSITSDFQQEVSRTATYQWPEVSKV